MEGERRREREREWQITKVPLSHVVNLGGQPNAHSQEDDGEEHPKGLSTVELEVRSGISRWTVHWWQSKGGRKPC